jgi:hypothetical protein
MSDALPPDPSRAVLARSTMPATPDVTRSSAPSSAPAPPTCRTAGANGDADAVVCERCGVAMFRMHAVWRCPGCGYKTDCCGW